jgi:type VI secretion system protein VasD
MDKLRHPVSRCPTPRSQPSRRAVIEAAAGLATLGALPGCSMFAPPPPPPPKPPPPPAKLSIKVVAATRLNPDSNGRSSPVTVRLYELKSVAQFNNADFMALFDQDKTVLAGDIATRDEFVLRPDESKAIDKLLAPDVQAVAVMAAFRDLERAKWRGVAMLVQGKDNAVVMTLDDVFVKVTQSAK